MSGAASLLLVEDDEVLGTSLVQRLNLEGVTCWWARTAAEGETLLRRHRPSLVVCDIRLPDESGEALLLRLMPEIGATPVIVATAYGEVAQAVRLLRAGADDYLVKPFPPQLLLEKLRLLGAPATAAPQAAEAGWQSPAMRLLASQLARLAQVTTPVLLSGESGAGKEIAARRLHALGANPAAPFVAVNCAAIPSELMESEVFGHERGAFTGATQRHEGFAERAADGTLFLDEIGELAPPLQAKLLRLLQERSFTRVGGRDTLPLHARIVAATNIDLQSRLADGGFRQDLYYRLAVVELVLPPLRERPEDLYGLAEAFAAHFARAFHRPGLTLGAPALEALLDHPWPGNVRELRNRIERAAILANHPILTPDDIFPGQAVTTTTPVSLAEARDLAERDHIRRVLARSGGRVAEAAQLLGISRTTMWERMRRLRLDS
ncbi:MULTISPECIES: sigma-54-dependent transcriptional regulator [Roseomonadaceae]|uniref:Sigma-54-dependent Fis family transcriptional regulator n=1 Tax=Falsiroseomonas oleicola TaxID=2801474 RepID=A0ABS6HDU9_9PROT|nr:sigma-54 dependent transcriptional regulator [Roseomonas oleicola]MBU8546864.1 sigma-54-dependent Fis family transcriptional regulator [Roseomonas oleicola]